MRALVTKIHIYFGLSVFAQLIVFGIAGVTASLQSGPIRPKNIQGTRFVPFTAPPSATDKQVAGLVYETLKLPLTRPMPDWFLRRTADNHLLLDFYNVNGIYRVVVLENEQRLRIENIPNNFWIFLEDMHAGTLGDEQAPRLARLWAAWNELAIWALLGFCVSGVYLWLSSQPRFIWAYSSLAIGLAGFAAMWLWFR